MESAPCQEQWCSGFWCWVIAHLYEQQVVIGAGLSEEQIFIGVIAVSQECRQPVFQSSVVMNACCQEQCCIALTLHDCRPV